MAKESDPTASIGFLLGDANRLFRQRFDAAAAEAGLGLTPGEARALGYVSKHEGARQTPIAEAMGVDPMTLVAFLDRLEGLGLVVRCPDPTDRRAKVIRLTETSAPVVAKIRQVAEAVRNEALEGLDEAERDVLRDLLRRIIAKLSAPETVSDAAC